MQWIATVKSSWSKSFILVPFLKWLEDCQCCSSSPASLISVQLCPPYTKTRAVQKTHLTQQNCPSSAVIIPGLAYAFSLLKSCVSALEMLLIVFGYDQFEDQENCLLTSFSPFFPHKSSLNIARVELKSASPSPFLKGLCLGVPGPVSNCDLRLPRGTWPPVSTGRSSSATLS